MPRPDPASDARDGGPMVVPDARAAAGNRPARGERGEPADPGRRGVRTPAALAAASGRMVSLAWLALAIAGQAAALQLMRAGPGIGYQRYAPLPELLGPGGVPWLAVLAVQTVVVFVAGRALWIEAYNWLRRHVHGWKLGSLAAAFVLTAAVLEREASSWLVHVLFGALVQLVALGTIVLAVKAVDARTLVAAGGALDRLLGERGSTGADRFPWWAAGYVVLATTLLGFFAYQWHPHVPDELVYLLHARYFAEGMLAMPLPPVPEAFELDLMTYEPDRWYSPVPPGWPAILSIGARFGVPWLVNPVLAGASVLLAYAFVRELHDLRTARIATLLLCGSPWFLFMAMNLMTHTFTLAAALAGAVAVTRMLRRNRPGWGVVAGISIGVLGLIRPLEGLTVAALFALWVVISGAGALRVTGVAVMALASIATGALTLPYNEYLSGEATTFPIMAYTDAQYGAGTNALGFGANRGLGWPGLDPLPGHGAADVVINTALNAYQVNVELLGWATGSILPLALLPLLGRMGRSDRMMVIAIVAIIVAHAFYWFSGGPDFGARYWYLALVPAIVLAARGVLVLAEKLEPGFAAGAAAVGGAGSRVLLGVAALCCAALLTFFPWRAADKYFHYRGMRPDVRRLAREYDFGTSLVLVRGRRFPDFASAAAYNPVDLRADRPIYAWDRDPEVRRAVLEAYVDRPVWIVAGPTITGRGFEIERGPTPAATLLREQ